MTLCRLPREALMLYLSLQIALTFTVVFLTDFTGATTVVRCYNYRNCYGWGTGTSLPMKVVIYLLSMSTILRCSYLLAKAYFQPDTSRNIQLKERRKCPFLRKINYIGAVAHELVMVAIWAVTTALSFVNHNAPAGGVAAAMLAAQLAQFISVIIETVRARSNISPASSLAASSAHSSISHDDTNYRSFGPMIVPQYRDADEVEKGYPQAKNLGQRGENRVQDEERLPRNSEDIDSEHESAEGATLLK